MIVVNEYGLRKVKRFRKRFILTTDGFEDKRYIDVHDYLHTELGAMPVYGIDEDRVLELENKIYGGEIDLSRFRGLTIN